MKNLQAGGDDDAASGPPRPLPCRLLRWVTGLMVWLADATSTVKPEQPESTAEEDLELARARDEAFLQFENHEG